MQSTTEPNTTGGWTPSEIRAALPVGAQARIARHLGKSRAAISDVVAGRNRSRRIEGEIAKTLHVKRELLFPVRREDASSEAA
jgi:hypothetical protein